MSDLERRLAEAAPFYPFPRTPDVVDAVRSRLRGRPAPRWPRIAAAVAVVALLAALAAPPTRSALLDLLDRVPGIDIQRVDELPAVPFTAEPAYGVPADLELARERVTIPLVLPSRLGAPDSIYVDDEHGAVTAVYGGERSARLVVTQFPARRVLFEKMLGYETRVEGVEVGGAPGLWIEGPQHDVFYDRDRRVGGYLAGNVLIWHDRGITYRLEADVPRSRALELAGTLRRV